VRDRPNIAFAELRQDSEPFKLQSGRYKLVWRAESVGSFALKRPTSSLSFFETTEPEGDEVIDLPKGDYIIAITGEAQRLVLSIRRTGDIRKTRVA
jgi:hypothetical protein